MDVIVLLISLYKRSRQNVIVESMQTTTTTNDDTVQCPVSEQSNRCSSSQTNDFWDTLDSSSNLCDCRMNRCCFLYNFIKLIFFTFSDVPRLLHLIALSRSDSIQRLRSAGLSRHVTRPTYVIVCKIIVVMIKQLLCCCSLETRTNKELTDLIDKHTTSLDILEQSVLPRKKRQTPTSLVIIYK